MSFTTEDIANVEFGTSAVGKRGYARARSTSSFSGSRRPSPTRMTDRAEVHHVEFSSP